MTPLFDDTMMMTTEELFYWLMRHISTPNRICEMVTNRAVHPHSILDAIDDGIAFQKRCFGPDYDLYEITQNLFTVRAFVNEFIMSMQRKRLRDVQEFYAPSLKN